MTPSNFFLGTMEFFAILVPGALFTFLLMPLESSVFKILPKLPDDKTTRWAAFALFAYFFGHLLHHFSAWLDKLYDDAYHPYKQKKNGKHLLDETRALMRKDLGSMADKISAFNWANSWVKARNVAAGTDLERSGAESKFFRSLCLTAILAACLFAARHHCVAAIISIALAGFSYWRFCKRRWDTSELAYQYFVMLRRFPQREVVLQDANP